MIGVSAVNGWEDVGQEPQHLDGNIGVVRERGATGFPGHEEGREPGEQGVIQVAVQGQHGSLWHVQLVPVRTSCALPQGLHNKAACTWSSSLPCSSIHCSRTPGSH